MPQVEIDLTSEIKRLQSRVEVLERQMKTCRQQVRDAIQWLDIHCSYPWKRIWWFLCGWRYYRLGTWRKSNWRERDGY